jgi:hypothetical protein
LKFFKNYFLPGDYVVRGVSLWRTGVKGKATAYIPPLGGADGVPATADMVAAFLYVQTAEKIQGSGIDNATFAGQKLGPFKAVGSTEPGSGTFAKPLVDWNAAQSPCWSVAYPGGRKLITYRVDVLRFLKINPLTGKQSLTTMHEVVVPDAGTIYGDDDEGKAEKALSDLPRAIGVSLVVAYRDRSKPFSAIVLYDGAFTKNAYATMDQTISGFYQSSSLNPSAKMTHIVGDGRPFLSERVYDDAQLIATNPFVSSLGAKWDSPTFQLPQFGTNLDKTVVRVDRHTLLSDCLTYSAMVFRTTVQDSDEDGLLDVWETNSNLTDPSGKPLPDLSAMGANANVKDLFAEIDYMNASSQKYGDKDKPAHSHLPSYEALKMVGLAFKNASPRINVHFDVGNNYQTPANLNDGYLVPFSPDGLARGGQFISENLACPDLTTGHLVECLPGQIPGFPKYPGTVGWKSGFQFLRDEVFQFDRTRKDMFRFVVFAHSVGIPKESCLNANGTANFTCQKDNPDFLVPRTNSGIADFPGGDLLVTLGAFDNENGQPVGTTYMQAATIAHEWGHNFEFTHGGPANPKINGILRPQLPREPNCKPQYLSVMNYLYQLRGLIDDAGVAQIDFAGQTTGAINEPFLVEDSFGSTPLPYRFGWYAPKRGSYVEKTANAATKHCDGTELTLLEKTDAATGGGMVRVNGTKVPGPFALIDWNANPNTVSGALDINFSGAKTLLNGGSNDWENPYLNENGGRRSAGGYYIDNAGTYVVGPMSLDIGRGDIGRGDIGRGDIGRGDIGRGDIGRGDIGRGDIGRGDIGRGDIGRGDIGRGYEGGGDLDVGSVYEFAQISTGVFGGELDFETAVAVEGGTPQSPPSSLQACLTSEGSCNPAGGNRPVLLSWEPPHFGKALSYRIYRGQYSGDFAPGSGLVDSAALIEPAFYTSGNPSWYDTSAPAGTQLVYFVRANLEGERLSGISNFATVTTPPELVYGNLLTNGDFETGNLTGWTQLRTEETLQQEVLTSPEEFLATLYHFAYKIRPGTESPGAGLKQTVNVVIGQEYSWSLSLAAREVQNPGNESFPLGTFELRLNDIVVATVTYADALSHQTSFSGRVTPSTSQVEFKVVFNRGLSSYASHPQWFIDNAVLEIPVIIP